MEEASHRPVLKPNKSDAPNPAIASWFQVGRPWRGVSDPCLGMGGCRAGRPCGSALKEER